MLDYCVFIGYTKLCLRNAKNAFKGSWIERVTIPSTVKTIESYAFLNCIKLKSVEIPKNVKTIYTSAFRSCKNLGTITFKGNTDVKSSAFRGIKKGATFKVPKKNKNTYVKSLPKCGAKKYKLKQT